MGMLSHANTRDAIEPEVCGVLDQLGIPYAKLNAPGLPDLLIGDQGVNWLWELKSETGKLTPKQAIWHARWRGRVCIGQSVEEVVGTMRPSAIFSKGCR
jgi:hypothetical protein